jgi:hypothetical protein
MLIQPIMALLIRQNILTEKLRLLPVRRMFILTRDHCMLPQGQHPQTAAVATT